MRNKNLIEKLKQSNEVDRTYSSDFEILNPDQAMSLIGGEVDCTSKCFINVCRTNCGQDCSTNTCCPDE